MTLIYTKRHYQRDGRSTETKRVQRGPAVEKLEIVW
jgi:hypothetical protein